MKKLMFSLCALCIVGAAGAQVSKLPVSEKAQRLSMPALQDMKMQAEQRDSKAQREDSIVVPQAAYDWSRKLSEDAFLFYPSTAEQKQNSENMNPCYQDVVRWLYGTGGPITWAGMGEFGYSFYTGQGTFYPEAYVYPTRGVPYAASSTLLRFASTSMNDVLMPFYFKLYDYTKVSPQSVIKDLQSGGYVNVIYPTDPERYSALSDTVWVPADCRDGKVEQFLAKAEFKDVPHWKRLGDNFSLSMMFPIDWDKEGDSILYYVGWNTMPWIMGSENNKSVISETPHSVYHVYDFERISRSHWQNLPEGHKRYQDFVEEDYMQPNMRYAVIPFDSWGDEAIGEPYVAIYYSDWTSLQSANKADRYVQLSPVPATDYVNFKSFTDMSRIEIYSLGGQLVKAVNVSDDTYTLDITDLNSGMYVARIYSEKGISSQKLIVR